MDLRTAERLSELFARLARDESVAAVLTEFRPTTYVETDRVFRRFFHVLENELRFERLAALDATMLTYEDAMWIIYLVLSVDEDDRTISKAAHKWCKTAAELPLDTRCKLAVHFRTASALQDLAEFIESINVSDHALRNVVRAWPALTSLALPNLPAVQADAADVEYCIRSGLVRCAIDSMHEFVRDQDRDAFRALRNYVLEFLAWLCKTSAGAAHVSSILAVPKRPPLAAWFTHVPSHSATESEDFLFILDRCASPSLVWRGNVDIAMAFLHSAPGSSDVGLALLPKLVALHPEWKSPTCTYRGVLEALLSQQPPSGLHVFFDAVVGAATELCTTEYQHRHVALLMVDGIRFYQRNITNVDAVAGIAFIVDHALGAFEQMMTLDLDATLEALLTYDATPFVSALVAAIEAGAEEHAASCVCVGIFTGAAAMEAHREQHAVLRVCSAMACHPRLRELLVRYGAFTAAFRSQELARETNQLGCAALSQLMHQLKD